MNVDFNYVKCPKCEHDRNPATAAKCEICGKPLRRNASKAPLLIGGLAALVALGSGAFMLKDKLLSAAKPDSTADATTASSSQPTATNSLAAPSGNAPAKTQSSSAAPVTGAIVSTYQRFADVPNIPQGTFNHGGSTTFAPLRSESVTAALKQAAPEFKLRYTDPPTGKPGSGKGIEMLLEGQLSFAESSRSLKDEELQKAKTRGFALEQVPVAIDAIVFYVNPDLVRQGIKGITLAQAKDIFTGKVTNWQQIGGPNLPIIPLSRNLQAGGTVDFFYEKVLDKTPLGSNVQEVSNTTLAIRQAATTPGSISYATAAEAINQKMIRLLALGKDASQPMIEPCTSEACTAINKASFSDGSYPLTRRLFVILKRDGKLDEQAGVAYANLLLSGEGQGLIEQRGFVPIR